MCDTGSWEPLDFICVTEVNYFSLALLYNFVKPWAYNYTLHMHIFFSDYLTETIMIYYRMENQHSEE
jgi:hypothetical protein